MCSVNKKRFFPHAENLLRAYFRIRVEKHMFVCRFSRKKFIKSEQKCLWNILQETIMFAKTFTKTKFLYKEYLDWNVVRHFQIFFVLVWFCTSWIKVLLIVALFGNTGCAEKGCVEVPVPYCVDVRVSDPQSLQPFRQIKF
jgi:hypothetical protein